MNLDDGVVTGLTCLYRVTQVQLVSELVHYNTVTTKPQSDNKFMKNRNLSQRKNIFYFWSFTLNIVPISIELEPTTVNIIWKM